MGTISGVTESFNYTTHPAVSWSDSAIQKINNLFSSMVDGIDAMRKACFAPFLPTPIISYQLTEKECHPTFSFDKPEENRKTIEHLRSKLIQVMSVLEPSKGVRDLGAITILVSLVYSAYNLYYCLNGVHREIPPGFSQLERNGTSYYYFDGIEDMPCTPLLPEYFYPSIQNVFKPLGMFLLGNFMMNRHADSHPQLLESGKFLVGYLNAAEEMLANPKFREFVQKKNKQETYTMDQILQYSKEFKKQA